MYFSRIIVPIIIGLAVTLASSKSVPVPCRGRIRPKYAKFCCIKFGIGCIQDGETCTTTRLNAPTPPCAIGLTCVVSDFGNPLSGENSKGTCQEISQKPKKCTIERCSRTGHETLCMISGVVATCGAWATRRDSGPKPECPRFCTLQLQIPQPKGSDGRLYGNEGCLIVASCESDFQIYGPVPRSPEDICKKPIGPLLQNLCCIDYGIDCARLGEVCTSPPGDKFIGPKQCEEGLTCVISDPGGQLKSPEGTCSEL